MPPSFRQGAREGFRAYFPISIGIIPWAIVTGVAMIGTGFTPAQAVGMNAIVFSGTAQLGTLPLIAAGAPLWLVVATALALNLRFVIFSAAIARGFEGTSLRVRWLAAYLLTDQVFAACLGKVTAADDRNWRLGYYLGPAVWTWLVWQTASLVGIFTADSIPSDWSLEFMATIALLILLVPMVKKQRPMLVAACAGAVVALVLRGLPLRIDLLIAIVTGICAGMLAERWAPRTRPVGEADER